MEKKPVCKGCNGEGTIQVSVQRIFKTVGRVCTEHKEVCPICFGTKVVTQEEVDAYFDDSTHY